MYDTFFGVNDDRCRERDEQTQAEIERLRAALGRAQWVLKQMQWIYDGNYNEKLCLVCYQTPKEGAHKPDCSIGKVLADPDGTRAEAYVAVLIRVERVARQLRSGKVDDESSEGVTMATLDAALAAVTDLQGQTDSESNYA